MDELGQSIIGDGAGFSRRGFLAGVVGFGAALGLASLGESGFWYEDALAAGTAPSGPPTTTLPLPTTTAPEQLRLTWGHDPATSVTVSWSAPGTVAQPAPTLAYSTSPITASKPGTVVVLPDPTPLDVTKPYPDAVAISFDDGLNAQTTFFYHVQLKHLEADTRYYYEISDGAATPSLIS
jgi:hypothetical protein